MISPPVISDSPTYQKPENGEGRHQPRPEAGLVNVVTARTVRVGVAGVRHDSVLFSLTMASVGNSLAACMFRPPPLSRWAGLRRGGSAAEAKRDDPKAAP
jgi:hypothetical protein